MSRILVVADEEIAGQDLDRELRSHLGDSADDSRVVVVAPALADSALKHEFGDIDPGVERARVRLEHSLEQLSRSGIDATGVVGDPDPVIAIKDGLQRFDPDEVILVSHRAGQQAYAESDILERVDRELDQPVTELVVDAAGSEPSIEAELHSSPGAEREKGVSLSPNMPRFIFRDILGISIGVASTAGLILLAATAGDADQSPITGGHAALLLIAMFAALINLAHVVGVLLFQTVGYRGIWERFFARLSLYGTPIALVVGFLLR
jgi:hypothetical protein